MRVVALGAGVYRIPTAGDYINSFALVADDGSVSLVDTGTRFARKKIVDGLAQIGKHPYDVRSIILTHAHADHAGSAAALVSRSRASGATVHVDDAERVRTGVPAPAQGTFVQITNKIPGFGWKPCPVVQEVHDGDMLDVAGGMSVHHTPGHTPGHISLVHRPSEVLITGDAIFNMNAKLSWPFAMACTDFPLNQQTAAVLADLDYSVAAFTHGPQIEVGAREAVRGFLRREGVVR
ncbi:MAG: MBL fold metallo-hydrolase [Candidatus Nanopelagicales bacterium]|jgi:glyoxylase-like metal-dependent hydrolase (beta-lactamase superfamily II)|nr:MBL fold metallo-hydrolase [Candidatus Nanopelagicales bacterium]